VIDRLDRLALMLLLALPLVLSPLVGLLTPYVSLLVIAPVFFAVLLRRGLRAAYASYEARAFLFIFVLFAVLFAVTADSASDGLRAFNFTMLLTLGPIALFLADRTRADGAERVAQFAALGVTIGLVEIIFSAWLGEPRPSGPNIGPIVLANGLLALGFIAAGAALFLPGRTGLAYLLVPVAATVATLVTASRGPLIAVPFLIVLLGWFLWRHRFGAGRRALLLSLAVLALLAIVAVAILASRGGSIVAIAGALLGGGQVEDTTTSYRLALYAAGWQSFLLSPWIGHGWANIMASVQPFLPADNAELTTLPQLHNDVVNFAVAAGVVGVAAYLVIVTTPLVGALLGPRDSLRPFRLYAAAVLVVTYVGGGLTDLMFGFEFHTWLFGMLTAIVLAYCREPVARP
jgi:O-antigen ligase